MSHIIYITAITVVEGRSMVDAVCKFRHKELLRLAFDFVDDESRIDRYPQLLLIGTDDTVSEDEKAAYVATLGW